jgi:O-antigen ligase
VWSLSAERLFGSSASFGDGTVVYPHNDFLFWAVDLGFPGILLFGLLWIGVALALAQARGSLPRPEWFAFLGIAITMLIASLVDNGIFIRSLGEPFFVTLGVLAAFTGGREVTRRWT